jgi:methylase of polypeptide subunit release factors
VLDLCTGTGCIPLLFQHEINRLRLERSRKKLPQHIPLRLLGVDISPRALELANHNLVRQLLEHEHDEQDSHGPNGASRPSSNSFSAAMRITLNKTSFIHADVLNPNALLAAFAARRTSRWDVLFCNPPYISPQSFANGNTTRSVQKFEPRLALVPPSPSTATTAQQQQQQQLPKIGHPVVEEGDTFYPVLVQIASEVVAKVVWLEVADMEQAERVARMIRRVAHQKDVVEIWREDPAAVGGDDHDEGVEMGHQDVERYHGFRVRGKGNGRSVAWWRGVEGRKWLKTARV